MIISSRFEYHATMKPMLFIFNLYHLNQHIAPTIEIGIAG